MQKQFLYANFNNKHRNTYQKWFVMESYYIAGNCCVFEAELKSYDKVEKLIIFSI